MLSLFGYPNAETCLPSEEKGKGVSNAPDPISFRIGEEGCDDVGVTKPEVEDFDLLVKPVKARATLLLGGFGQLIRRSCSKNLINWYG